MFQSKKNHWIFILLFAVLGAPAMLAQQNDRVGVVVHIMRDDNGNGGISESDARAAVDIASAAFDVIDIDFFVVQVEYHNDSQYSNLTRNELEGMLATYNSYSPNQTSEQAINLYFVPSYGGGRGVATLPPSRAILVGESFEQNGIVIENEYALTSTVPHEFGHFFGLLHTYETSIGFEHPDGSNGLTAGDLMSDTKAEPDPTAKPNWDENCNFVGKNDFSGGVPYLPGVQENSDNYMTSGEGGDGNGSCRTRFTTEQQNHMRDQFDPGGNFDDRSDLKDRIWIQVVNEIDDLNAGGTYIVSSQTYNSGDYFLYPGQAVDITTGQERLQTDHKHHDWNDVNQEYKLTLEDFTGSLSTPPQFADFEEMKGAVVQNSLISANGADDGKIKFHDPWFLESDGSQPDAFIEFDSPFQPTGARNETSGGVFLNQFPPTDPNVEKPYYSVRAVDNQQVTVNGKSITWDWESWSYDPAKIELQSPNNPETAVVFKQDGATLTANLKGRQVSSTTSATAGNNSRKVVWAEPGATAYYFQTYIDNGHVYYSYSTNAGASWSKEERVSQSGGNSEPCIAVAEDMSKITVVWNNNGEFLWRSKSGVSGSWGSIYSENPLLPGSVSTKPAAINHNGNIYVAKRYKYSSNPQTVELYKINGNNQLTWLGQIDGSGADNPTITKRIPAIYDSRVFLAWEKNNGIYYRSFNTGNSTFSSIETVVTPGSGIYFHNTPSIAYSLDNRINIAWAGSSGSVKYLLIRSKNVNSSSWGPQSTIYTSYSDLTQPSIGAYYNSGQTGWLNISVKFGSNNVRTLQ